MAGVDIAYPNVVGPVRGLVSGCGGAGLGRKQAIGQQEEQQEQNESLQVCHLYLDGVLNRVFGKPC